MILRWTIAVVTVVLAAVTCSPAQEAQRLVKFSFKTFTETHEAPFRIEDYLTPRYQLLVEGTSVRSAERVTGLHRDAILKLLVVAGERCEVLMDSISNVPATEIQADEI